MAKLKLIKEKPALKVNKEVWQDANDVLSVSPESKKESRMFTPKELEENGRTHAGKYS